VVNYGFRRTTILGLSAIALITSCGDNIATQSPFVSVEASHSAITSAATDPVSSDAVGTVGRVGVHAAPAPHVRQPQ
jgi:hypothetical protein